MRAPPREFGADPRRPSFIPNKARVSLRYSEVAINVRLPTLATAANLNYFKLSLNGLADPYVPLGGHYHRGLEKYWKLYQTYTVTRAKVRWWVDLDTINMIGGDTMDLTVETGAIGGQELRGQPRHFPLSLFSQISADTSQGDLAPATYDAGGVYNWPSVAGSNTKVTTTTTKQIMDRSIEGPLSTLI